MMGNQTPLLANILIVTSGHTPGLNWMAGLTFAEHGLQKVGMTYAGGDLRTRQSATLLRTSPTGDPTVIMSETMYDELGRPTVNTLPVPTQAEHLQYFPIYFRNDLGLPYSRDDFGDVNTTSPPIEHSSDAAAGEPYVYNYYSPNNGEKSEQHAHIPDAQGYPFAQVQYTPDNTGRVRAQGGPGPDHQLRSGHETKMFYATPDNDELEKLFGTEVGEARHYKKNMTIDPNGQVSVAYINASGQTVATALSGKTPNQLEDVADDGSQDPATETRELIDPDNGAPIEGRGENLCAVVEKTELVDYPKNYTFEYSLEGAKLFKEENGVVCFCYDCVYNLSFSVIDECGDEVFAHEERLDDHINGDEYYDDCLQTPPVWDRTWNFPLNEVGSYQIKLELCVDKEARDAYLERFLDPETNPCLPDELAMIEAEENNLTIPLCDITYCELSCLDQIDPEQFEDIADFNEAVRQCTVACEAEPLSNCDVTRRFMLEDLTPGGQYAQYDVSGQGVYSAENYPYSILNADKRENEFRQLRYGGPFPSMVIIPLPISNLISINDRYYQSPAKNLKSVDYRVLNGTSLEVPHSDGLGAIVQTWTMEHAEAMLPYHPEYCYLEWCAGMQAIRAYDEMLVSTTTYQDAVSKGLIVNGNSDPQNREPGANKPIFLIRDVQSGMTNRDPFFEAGGYGERFYNDFFGTGGNRGKLDDMYRVFDLQLSVEDLAALIIHDPESSLVSRRALLDDFRDDKDIYAIINDPCFSDQVWNMLKMLYLSAKSEYVEKSKRYLQCYQPHDLAADGDHPKRLYIPTMNDALEFGDEFEDMNEVLEELNKNNKREETKDELVSFTNDQMAEHCQTTCEEQAKIWMAKLTGCINIDNPNLSQTQREQLLDELKDKLIAVCVAGCDYEHPFGSSTTPTTPANPTGVPSSLNDKSFSEAITEIMQQFDPNFSDNPLNQQGFYPFCNSFRITMPKPWDHSYSGASTETLPSLDTCACNKILEARANYSANDFDTPQEYFEDQYGEKLLNFQSLACDCDEVYKNVNDNYPWIPSVSDPHTPVYPWTSSGEAGLQELNNPIPPSIACRNCVDCHTVAGFYQKYSHMLGVDYPDGEILLAEIINRKLNQNFTFLQYSEFHAACKAMWEEAGCDPTSKSISLAAWLDQMASNGDLTKDRGPLTMQNHSLFFEPNLYGQDASCNPQYSTQLLYARKFNEEIYYTSRARGDGLLVVGSSSTSPGNLTVGSQNKDGSWLWVHELPGNFVPGHARITRHINNKVYVTGILEAIPPNHGMPGKPRRVAIAAFDEFSGDMRWFNAYTDETIDALRFSGLRITNNFDVAVAFASRPVGSTKSGDGTTIITLDTTGVLQNHKTLPLLGDHAFNNPNPSPYQDRLAVIGNQIYLGGMSVDNGALSLYKFDRWLNLTDEVSYPDVNLLCGPDHTSSLTATDDGRLVFLVRQRTDYDGDYSFVIYTDEDGIVQYSKDIRWRKPDANPSGDDGLLQFDGHTVQAVQGGKVLISGLFSGNGHSDVVAYAMLNDVGDPLWNVINPRYGESALAVAINEEHIVMLSSQEHLANRLENLASRPDARGTACKLSWTYVDASEKTVNTGDSDFTEENHPVTTHPGADEQPGKYEFTPDCGEMIYLRYWDNPGCGTDCEIILTLEHNVTEAAFYRLENIIHDQLGRNGGFDGTGQYTYDGQPYSPWVQAWNSCNACPDSSMCDDGIFLTFVVDTPDCEGAYKMLAVNRAKRAYQRIVEKKRAEFIEEYNATCLDVTQSLQLTREVQEYHYTLYYYDQSGHLVRTVPPEGVDLDNQQHRLNTYYRYNSLGNLVRTATPDGGISRTWYDQLGRVIISQNAEQFSNDPGLVPHRYSYMRYDELGRIYESGQLSHEDEPNAGQDPEFPIPIDDYKDWFEGNGAYVSPTDIRYRTVTHYSEGTDNTDIQGLFPGGTQRNLRNRVAYVKYYGKDDATVDHATYYSYDIHGNVDFMVQEIPQLEHFNGLSGNEHFELFTIRYDYDLLSGNVNEVAYQEGRPDQFFDRYSYDADNRIDHVETSADGVTWDQDARYHYYKHGPLSRVELGEEQVQGIDYAYTIQGCLKGVNSDKLIPDMDQGKDGFDDLANANRSFTKDAFGFSLHYFQGDYQSINPYNAGTNPGGSRFAAGQQWIAGATPARNLYNGNISRMGTTISLVEGKVSDNSLIFRRRQQLNAYTYDQLHRIREMQVVSQGISGNTWNTGVSNIQAYRTNYTYDANGNIHTLQRSGSVATPQGGMDMDDLSYQYQTVGGEKIRNRLLWVDESITNTRAAYDKDYKYQPLVPYDASDPSTWTYNYDAIGNLISDKEAQIAEIVWTPSGKIQSITRESNADPDKPDLEFGYDAGGNRLWKKVIPRDGNPVNPPTYTYYLRDAQGNILATYERDIIQEFPANIWYDNDRDVTESLVLSERHLFGSSRLGMVDHDEYLKVIAYNGSNYDIQGDELYFDPPGPDDPALLAFFRGRKLYELSNHLGNVLAVISDRKLQLGSPSTVEWIADLRMSSDYYPFGMKLDGRGMSMGYRFGFQGQEEDGELYDGAVSYKYRVHDPRIGRFLSVDPLASSYPFNSPYTFSENRVIDMVELEGLESTTPTIYVLEYTSKLQEMSSLDIVEETRRIINGKKPTKPPRLSFMRRINPILKYISLLEMMSSLTSFDATARRYYKRYWKYQKVANGESEMPAHLNTSKPDYLEGQEAVEEARKNLAALGAVIVGFYGEVEIFTNDPSTLSDAYLREVRQRISSGNARPADWKYIDEALRRGIWTRMSITQENYPGTSIPKSFLFDLENGETIWIHPNATKHVLEYAVVHLGSKYYSGDYINLSSQIELGSLLGAVDKATENGIKYGTLMVVDGWELKFGAPKEIGQLPVLFHARKLNDETTE
jgi:RHS repeat-associated protein